MNVLFLGYRDWAITALEAVKNHPVVEKSLLIKSQEQLEEINFELWDILITLGWSDELGPVITDKIFAIGLHCAELDRYSYGSPIQLQIIDGLISTKHRVFPFKYDANSKRAHTHTREYSHEVDLSLQGNISEIFSELTRTAIILLEQFLIDYPNITWHKWPEEEVIRQKRNPNDSQLDMEQIRSMSAIELYNFIRCLGDPYPNARITDDTGTLYFKEVTFSEE